jgi:HD domain-containing protein
MSTVRYPHGFDPKRESSMGARPPGWVLDSALLADCYALAAEAHASQRRATDRALFLDHVLEVATLLHRANFGTELVAAGLLHDAVERGTLTQERLRPAVGEDISSLVLSLTEDDSIQSFEDRKAALREQVREAGNRAVTIFAADKLSDIRGLRRGIDTFGDSIEARMGTTIDGMAGHYRESVEMIEASDPRSSFLPALHAELESLTTPLGGSAAASPAIHPA